MSCSIQSKITQSLIDSGVVDSTTKEILNPVEFNRINKGLTQQLDTAYGITNYGQTLYNEKNGKYTENQTLFDVLNGVHAKSLEVSSDILPSPFAPIGENETEAETTKEQPKEEPKDTRKEEAFDEAMQNPVEEDQDGDPAYYKLNTLKDRLNHMVNDIKDNLEISIQRYQTIAKRSGENSVANQSATEGARKLQEILEDVNKLKDTQQWSAITSFVKELNSTVTSLTNRLNAVDFDSKTDSEVLQTISYFKKFSDTVAIIPDMRKFIREANNDIDFNDPDFPLTREEFNDLKKELANASTAYEDLNHDMHIWIKKAAVSKLSNKKYATRVLSRWRKRLRKEYLEKGITGSRSKWIKNQMDTTYAAEIKDDIEEYMLSVINGADFDIGNATKLFSATLNTNSKLIEVFQVILDEIKEAITTAARKWDVKSKPLFDRLVAEKGNVPPSKLYANLLEKDSEGNHYLKGQYKLEWKEKHEKLKTSYQEAYDKLSEEQAANNPFGVSNDEDIKEALKNHEYVKWKAENTKESIIEKRADGVTISEILPADKWKNNMNLSAVEQEVYDFFLETMTESNDSTFGIGSLFERQEGAQFIKLPAVTKSALERSLELDFKGLKGDVKKNFTTTRPDDVGYDEVYTDAKNKEVRNIKVHYRGQIEPENQSLDLFTLMRMEHRNGLNFKHKNEREGELITLVDIAKDKTFYKSMSGVRGVISKLLKNNKRQVQAAGESNTYARMQGLLESNIYDVMHKNEKFGNVDANKLTSAVNSWAAVLGLGINEVTAVTNVLNGKSQLLLEALSGGVINRKNATKAEGRYMRDLASGKIFSDLGKPVKESFTNQVNEMFDTYGLVASTAGQAFIKNNLAKSKINVQSLSAMQEMGEHWMQSVLTNAVLDSVKAMNADGALIDKNGNEVDSKDKAASLLDMLTMVDGELTMDPKVVYTSHTPDIKYDEGGKQIVKALVRQKVYDTAGNYTEDSKAEIKKHWYGKLLMMFRGFMPPGVAYRFRGFFHVLGNVYSDATGKDMRELKEEERFYSYALQEDVNYGAYTQSIDFTYKFVKSMYQALKQQKLALLRMDWDSMSDIEKAQVKRGVMEIVASAVLLPKMLIAGLGYDDDDKLRNDLEPYQYFMILQLKRLEVELSGYYSIGSQFRLLNSPIPSIRVIEGGVDIFKLLLSPGDWFDEFESGPRKGKSKSLHTLRSIIPILNRSDTTYKQKIQYLTYQAS